MDRFWDYVTISGEAILYSGRTDGRHHERVAIFLSEAAVSDRVHPVGEEM